MTVEREDFIHAMRSVANSVAVVTTDGAAGRHGATVTAFFSCVLANTLAAGSHVAAVGRVHHVYTAPEHPLAYVDGGYACVTRLPALVPA